jgi:predicted RNA binding protein YcfA (HicA-like mRNA interferase family)
MKSSDWKQLISTLEKLGYTFKRGGSGHWKVYKNDAYITTMPHSSSDYRAIRNKKSDLRRLGIAI